MKTKTLKAKDEFVVGKHSIGWVDSDFKTQFGDKTFTPKKLGTYQKLPHYFSNADEIEKELSPGKCELGDVYAFLENPPEGTKDGYANIFLIGDKVVTVRWHSAHGGWVVLCWLRGYGWRPGSRVFSPETGSKALGTGHSDSLSLPDFEILPVEVREIETIATRIEYKGKLYKLEE